MFTGIIEHTGRLVSLADRPFGKHLVIAVNGVDGEPPAWVAEVNAGDSIAVNGCCLTQSREDGDPADCLAFDVIPETLAKTSLGDLTPGRSGSLVNLETSLTANKPISGHFVQGHIDATGEVASITTGDEWRIAIRVDRQWLPYIVPKGSIAIDGISLTIASVDKQACVFDVAIIPTTLELTNLGQRKVGDRVNLETDMLVRSIVHWMETQAGESTPSAGTVASPAGVTMQTLRNAGFVD